MKSCTKCKKNSECECFRTKNKNTNNLVKGDSDWLEYNGGGGGQEELLVVSEDSSNSVVKCDIKCSDNVGDVEPALYSSLCVSTTSMKMGTSSDSCDSERGEYHYVIHSNTNKYEYLAFM